MPYIVTICNDCDMLVYETGPHGPEDEYCEGEGDYSREELFTRHEIGYRIRKWSSEYAQAWEEGKT